MNVNLIHPLDLLFFKGTDIISKAVLIGERLSDGGYTGQDQFSHVAIVVNKALLNIPQMDPMLFT